MAGIQEVLLPPLDTWSFFFLFYELLNGILLHRKCDPRGFLAVAVQPRWFQWVSDRRCHLPNSAAKIKIVTKQPQHMYSLIRLSEFLCVAGAVKLCLSHLWKSPNLSWKGIWLLHMQFHLQISFLPNSEKRNRTLMSIAAYPTLMLLPPPIKPKKKMFESEVKAVWILNEIFQKKTPKNKPHRDF